MFTGIIEEVGKIKNIQGGTNYKLTIGASKILEDIHLGDSIAVNGICLTVISWDNGSFTVDVMRETLERTSLHRLRAGSFVNLERRIGRQRQIWGTYRVRSHRRYR